MIKVPVVQRQDYVKNWENMQDNKLIYRKAKEIIC